MNRPVLVTGAYGFIGRHVARALAAEGQTVIGLGHGAWSREQWREWGIAEWHAADLTLDNLVTHAGLPGAVIHCAGSGSVGFSATHPHQDYQRTVETTAAVLEFVRLYAKDAAVVYPSSVAVYGHVGRQPIAETQALNPVSPYGVHKQIAEQLCATSARHFGIKAAIVRLFSVYGPRLRKQLLWDVCSRLAQGKTELVLGGTGDEIRDWTDVRDVVRLLTKVGELPKAETFRVINGGSGRGTSVAVIANLLVSHFDRDITVRFSGAVRAGDPFSLLAEDARLREMPFDWRVPIDQGLADYVRWFKDQSR